MAQVKFPAAYMRGGTSKGVFFRGDVLPADPTLRDRILLRVIGSPDAYKRHIDGMGGATSSTSKVVIVSPSARPDCDVDYLFAQLDVASSVVDYSGGCGNLVAAVGPFAIEEGMVPATGDRTRVRIWQVNTQTRIDAYIPTRDGLPRVEGDYEMDGVPNPGAEIRVEFLDPGDPSGRLFPTGQPADVLDVPGVGAIRATMLMAGNPCVFVVAADLGLQGTELKDAVDARPELLERLEAIRSHAAVAMGLAPSAAAATANRPATPKVGFVSPPRSYQTTDGEAVSADRIDLVARIVSMGKLHHATPATAAVAIAVAALVPGTTVNAAARPAPELERIVRFGHPAGVVELGAAVAFADGQWAARKVITSRTARRLMEGAVLVPETVLGAKSTAGGTT